MNYPCILIVSHNALSLHSNNGKTLNSIFSSWPGNSISQIYFQDEIPESIKFTKFFRIRDIDLLLHPFRILFKRSPHFCIQPKSRVLDHLEDASRWKLLIVNILKKFNAFKLVIRDLIYGTGFWKSAALKSWLDENSPDVIFFLGGNSIFSFKIARALARQLNIPLNVYITDDYVINDDDASLLARFMRHRLKAEYRLAFAHARHVFVIGDEMANVFKKEFGRNFISLMNSVPVPAVLPTVSTVIDAGRTIKFVYAGGLHLGRDFAIIKFASLLKNIGESHDLKFEFRVYSLAKLSDRVLELFDENGIDFMGGISSDRLQNVLTASDFVLHVESFEPKYIKLTKLSVSTKIPEYLTSGACLVAYGPAELASIKLISNNSLGVAVTGGDSDSKGVDELVRVICDKSFKNTLVENGFNYAKNNFDIEAVQQKILQLLKE